MPKDAPMSVMASGTYRHYYELNGQRYSHILDARTGKPVTHDLVAVTVLNENPTVADAWSTALLCLGQQDGIKLANAEKINAIFIRQRGSEFLETRSEALNTATNLAIQ
jgi:thiamine biosynthesis lipoprotein